MHCEYGVPSFFNFFWRTESIGSVPGDKITLSSGSDHWVQNCSTGEMDHFSSFWIDEPETKVNSNSGLIKMVHP